MAEILTVHPLLMAKGGGESVCMNVLEALQADHELTLLTVEHPNLSDLNEYYSTSVVDIEIITVPGITAYTYEYLPSSRFNRLRISLLSRYINKNELGEDYDIIFSTSNELPLPSKSIQYIHLPNFDRDALPDTKNNSVVYDLYDLLCEFVSPEYKKTNSIKYLTNSEWMGEKVTDAIGETPQTVYPPTYTDDFDPILWDNRNDSIVSVGRISPEKNILRNIQIVSNINDRGYSLDYFIVGPSSDRKISPFLDTYQQKVEESAKQYDFVHLEGEVSRERLVKLISSSKYGLHGMDYEHFGIAVAELVAGGTIPFVPRGGGQREIVEYCEKVMYDSVSDAVEKMDYILSNEEEQQKVKEQLPNVEKKFGQGRFQREIREITEESLS